MNTEEFADKIKMEKTTLWRRFNNPDNFTLDEITRIAEVLNIKGNRNNRNFFCRMKFA